MALVVDASVALAWALPDESSVYADAALAVAEAEGLRVPDLWAREVANGLAVAYLRKRITPIHEQAFLAALSHLDIRVEHSPGALTVIREGTAAAMRYGLTALQPTTQRTSSLPHGKNWLLPLSTRQCAKLPNKRGS
jgi:predicted nucleic acid-binding protein